MSDHTTNWTASPDGWLHASYGYQKSAIIVPPRVGQDEIPMLGMNEGYRRVYQGSHWTVLECMEKADELAQSYGWTHERNRQDFQYAPKP